MDVIDDRQSFDGQQMFLLRLILDALHGGTLGMGLTGEQRRTFLADTAFELATLLDGSTVLELDGRPFIRMLGFAVGGARQTVNLLPGGSWMHEYVHGMVDEYLENA